MKVLLVGTAPPSGGATAEAFGALAAQYVANGDVVEIISSDHRSAAHLTERLDGFRLALRLRAAAPRFDAVVLRFERGLPFAGDEQRFRRAVMLAALGYVLRGFAEVHLRLDTPIPIPSGLGGRATRDLWSRAEVVVANEEDRKRVLEVPWVTPERVTVLDRVHSRAPLSRTTWPAAESLDPRPAVLAVVRRRAAAARRLDTAAVVLGPPVGKDDISPFDVDTGPTKTDLRAVTSVVAKKVLRRLVAASKGR